MAATYSSLKINKQFSEILSPLLGILVSFLISIFKPFSYSVHLLSYQPQHSPLSSFLAIPTQSVFIQAIFVSAPNFGSPPSMVFFNSNHRTASYQSAIKAQYEKPFAEICLEQNKRVFCLLCTIICETNVGMVDVLADKSQLLILSPKCKRAMKSGL